SAPVDRRQAAPAHRRRQRRVGLLHPQLATREAPPQDVGRPVPAGGRTRAGGQAMTGGLDSYVAQLLLYLLGAGVVGLVGAVWKLYHDFNAYKLEVAREFVRDGALDEIKDELKSMREVIYRMAIKLEVT